MDGLPWLQTGYVDIGRWDPERVEGMLGGIRTRFLRDRAAETRFEEFAKIADLALWEELTADGPPPPAGMFQPGYGSWRFWCRTRARYPVECACMAEELDTGAYTSPDQYGAWSFPGFVDRPPRGRGTRQKRGNGTGRGLPRRVASAAKVFAAVRTG